jgi:DNA-binding NtrC family response regulator
MSSILLVDDGALIASWLSEILRRERYDVTIVHDERQALRVYNEQLHTLIITDLRVPEGMEMIEELLRRNPNIRILAIVGGELIHPDSILNVASAFGALRMIRKPFSLETFLKTVAEQLSHEPHVR